MTEPIACRNTGFITVNGVRLEYTWHGPLPEKAPTLVFLHEGLGCVERWRDFPAKLTALTGCGSLVYSRQGYGLSDPCTLPRPLRYMHDEALEVLPTLINVAGLRDYFLVGHSDGGSIALIYAGVCTDDGLKGVITEAPHVYCEKLSVSAIEAAKESYECEDLYSRLKKYHHSNTDCAFWGWNGAWLDPGFVSWNIEAFLAEIRVPLLVIQGENDQYGTRAQVDAIATQAGAGAEVRILKSCDHSPHLNQHLETLELMQSFIGRISG